MSFILDALKKSESDRQSQTEAEFAAVPSSLDPPATPRWLWVLGVLLVINALVLFAFVRQPSAPSLPAPTPASAPAIAANAEPDSTLDRRPGDDVSFASQIEEVRRQQPAAEPVTDPARARAVPTSQRPPPVSVANLPVSRAAIVPTLMELRIDGTLQLPDLHLDIHVYNNVPENRFVFIDMNKYQENSRLDSGPTVQEITSDGVILTYQGITFLLPRE